ncbi:MAG: cytochrome b/b6 domain-containing protein [Bryobacteraceae bacterium]
MTCRWIRAARVALAIAAAGFLQAQSPCVSCHEEESKKAAASAHAGVSCATCHPKHEAYPHAAGTAKPSCAQCHSSVAAEHAASVHGRALKAGNAGAPACDTCHGAAHQTVRARSQDFRKGVPETCGMCHDGVVRQFQASVHGKALAQGLPQAPVCTDCHGEHGIQKPTSRASLVHPSHIRETCAACHANVRLSRKFGLPSDRVVSFDASYHGLASKAGSQTVANCASCHGFHNILPSSDPKSTIHAKNLPATCGKCHPGAGTRLALGPVHLWEGRTEPASVRMVRQIYMVLIPVLIGLMLLYNAGDWIRKLRRMRLDGYAPAPSSRYADVRMYFFERVLHALLAVSFLTLAWTGFQLTYPEEWWARPFLQWEERWSVRGVVHRGASVVFLLTGVMHVVSLAASRRLRLHWRNLWPNAGDVTDALRGFAYNLGLSSRRPRLPSYSFVEKAEYWAVVWGGVVMGATGLLLWADNLTLKWFSKAALDFAVALHFYEAVLACLAIVVWHFYVVIFDPYVYPIDTAFLNGYGVREHEPPLFEEARAGKASR